MTPEQSKALPPEALSWRMRFVEMLAITEQGKNLVKILEIERPGAMVRVLLTSHRRGAWNIPNLLN